MKNNIEWQKREKPTNPEQIKAFEAKCGYKFPKSYIDLVLKFNGAEVYNYMTSFFIYNENGEKVNDVFGVGAFLAFGEQNVSDETSLIDWFWENRNCDENYPFPNHLVPFAYDGGGNYLCFDYRHNQRTNNPRVVFWFHEEAGQLKEGLEVYYAANSFDEFLDCLFDNRTQAEKERDAKIRKEYLEMYGDK